MVWMRTEEGDFRLRVEPKADSGDTHRRLRDEKARKRERERKKKREHARVLDQYW